MWEPRGPMGEFEEEPVIICQICGQPAVTTKAEIEKADNDPKKRTDLLCLPCQKHSTRLLVEWVKDGLTRRERSLRLARVCGMP